MRILVISDKSPGRTDSGGALAVRSMVSGLLSLGAGVDLLSIITRKHPAVEPGEVSKIPGQVNFHQVYINTGIKPVKLLRALLFYHIPLIYARFLSSGMKSYLKKLLSENKYDVVQLEGLNLAPYIDTIREHSRALISFRAHNVENKIWDGLAMGHGNGIWRFILRMLARRIKRYEIKSIQACDTLVPISTADLDYFRAEGISSPATTIPYAISKLPQIESPVQNCTVFGIIGSLDWRPNQEGLIWFFDMVLGRLRSLQPGIVIRIAGRNAPLWLVDRIKGTGIEYYGEVKSSEEFILGCTAIIIPLLSGSGMRIRIIESMSLGVPVITTNIGVGDIKAGKESGLYISDSPDGIIRNIYEIAGNSDLMLTLRDKARNYILENHIEKEIFPSLEEFYKKQSEC